MHRSPHEVIRGVVRTARAAVARRGEALDRALAVGNEDVTEKRATEHSALVGPLAPRDGRVVEAREREEILDGEPVNGVLDLRLERVAELLVRAREAADAQKAHHAQRAARHSKDRRDLPRALNYLPELEHDSAHVGDDDDGVELDPDRAAEFASQARSQRCTSE